MVPNGTFFIRKTSIRLEKQAAAEPCYPVLLPRQPFIYIYNILFLTIHIIA